MRNVWIGLLCALLAVGMSACNDDTSKDTDNGGENGNGDNGDNGGDNGNGGDGGNGDDGNGGDPETGADWVHAACEADCTYDSICDDTFDEDDFDACMEGCEGAKNFNDAPASSGCLDAIEELAQCHIDAAEAAEDSCDAGATSMDICVAEEEAGLEACAEDYDDFFADEIEELHAACTADCEREFTCDQDEADYEICLDDCDVTDEAGAMIGATSECFEATKDLYNCTDGLACDADLDDLMDACSPAMEGLEEACPIF